MSQRQVTIARVYTLEGHDHLNQTLEILQQGKVAGVTVIRGIAGIGSTGELHTSSLLSLSLALPIIIEFHDEPEKIASIITMLKAKLDLKHIVSWPATAHI
ncbi:MAG: DUF190 domain-containing protein [Methylococcaceae bacterium]|nr:DUF190 domain-containing protein [Methylococcaceae bacterium]